MFYFLPYIEGLYK